MENPHAAHFRFYEELNDFLPPEQRRQTLRYGFDGHPGIKDPIEAFGVPHTEVDIIVVDGVSVGFDYRLQPGDRMRITKRLNRVLIASGSGLRCGSA